MELAKIREQIDGIDSKLLSLLLERMSLSAQEAGYKSDNALAAIDRKREREILSGASKVGEDMELYAHRFLSTVLELSKSYKQSVCISGSSVRTQAERGLAGAKTAFPQTGMIACQGVEGAYSQMAADKMFPRGNLVFFKTFEAVFDAVESGFCQFGVVPIENSSNGSVRETYDLLRTKKARIVRSQRMFIKHELLAKPGTTLEQITEIHSHPQALGQCSRFIKSLGEKVTAIPCTNTAAASELAAATDKPGVAAIASHNCGKLYGLVPVAGDIQDSDNNYTRFICIAKEADVYPGADHISLIIACEHKPGALYEILAKLAALEVNLIKLESCPIVGHDFEFMFFLELQASVADARVLSMLESIERECDMFVYLGNYCEA